MEDWSQDPQYWKAETRYRIERLSRGESGVPFEWIVWALVRALALGFRCAFVIPWVWLFPRQDRRKPDAWASRDLTSGSLADDLPTRSGRRQKGPGSQA